MKHSFLIFALLLISPLIGCSKTIEPTDPYGIQQEEPKEYKYESAMWLWSSHATQEAIDHLVASGIETAIMNEYIFTAKGDFEACEWINNAAKKGISVHLWIQCFYSSGKWINPIKDGVPDQTLFDSIIEKAVKYAQMSNVSGIHLDYLRYPGTAYKTQGGTEAVTEFARQLSDTLKTINPKIILSAAVMPETTADIQYYGQNIPDLGKYLDVICPMVYKGNYKQKTEWITTTSKWFLDNCGKAKVWVGLQTYYSDESATSLPTLEMQEDIKAALKAGDVGVVFFRYGLFKWFTVNKF